MVGTIQRSRWTFYMPWQEGLHLLAGNAWLEAKKKKGARVQEGHLIRISRLDWKFVAVSTKHRWWSWCTTCWLINALMMSGFTCWSLRWRCAKNLNLTPSIHVLGECSISPEGPIPGYCCWREGIMLIANLDKQLIRDPLILHRYSILKPPVMWSMSFSTRCQPRSEKNHHLALIGEGWIPYGWHIFSPSRVHCILFLLPLPTTFGHHIVKQLYHSIQTRQLGLYLHRPLQTMKVAMNEIETIGQHLSTLLPRFDDQQLICLMQNFHKG